jgi:hypothetical protein
MSEIDADELARMRADTLEAKAKCRWHVNVKPDAVLASSPSWRSEMKSFAAIIVFCIITAPASANPDDAPLIKIATAAFEAGFQCGRSSMSHDECKILNIQTLLRAMGPKI